MMRRVMAAVGLAAGMVVPLAYVGGAPAGACGGLVGENGTVALVKTTTLAAYSDGIERYVTAFEFTGEGEEVGSIVPLPDVPTEVVRGGDWTLQRLVQEVAPPQRSAGEESEAAADSAGSAEVILETQIDALDITVLRGGGDEVGQWASDNGFLLTPDAPEVLDFYAARSPVFMAAKFDATRADALDQQAGDSTPIMAVIPTDNPWVPLRILGLGLDDQQTVEADVFLLTESDPALLAGGPGIAEVRSEPASELLLDDLRSDERMEWVPQDMWLSYLQVDTAAEELNYDLAVSTDPEVRPALVDTGLDESEPARWIAVRGKQSPWPALAAVGLVVLAVLLAVGYRRRAGAGAVTR